MFAAAEELRFEYAAKLRDEIKELRRELSGAGRSDAARTPMCRNIRTLHNFEPPATEEEVRVRGAPVRPQDQRLHEAVPGEPRRRSTRAVDEVAAVSSRLLRELVTTAPPRNREVEAARARARAAQRFGTAA